MASVLRRAMVYLGLVDDDYDDMYDGQYDDQQPQMASPVGARAIGATEFGETQGNTVRALPREESTGIGTITTRPAVVRSITPLANARVHVVVGKSFEDAKEIGDTFRKSQPVIVNLQAVDRDLRRRMVDFCSGLTYGLEGKMKQVAEGVLLLTPSNVEVPEEERRRLQERGYRT